MVTLCLITVLDECSFEMFTSFEMQLPPDDVRDKSGFCVFLSDCSGREGGREGGRKGLTEEGRQGKRRQRGREEIGRESEKEGGKARVKEEHFCWKNYGGAC